MTTLPRFPLLLAASAVAAGGAVVAEGSRSEVQFIPALIGVLALVLAPAALWQSRGLSSVTTQASAVFATVVLPLLTALTLDLFGYGIEMRGIAYATFALWAVVLWLGALGLTILFALQWTRRNRN